MMRASEILHVALRNLILPPSAPMLIMFAGWLLARWYRRTGIVLAQFGFVMLWLLCTPAVAYHLERVVERYPPLDLSRAPDAQAIVILSAGTRANAPEYHEDAPDNDTLQRITYGAYVARRTGLPVLVSGGAFRGQNPVAFAMQHFLQEELQTPVRWVESASHDTHENALDSAAMLQPQGIRRIVLVTSGVHMPRSVEEFKAVGFEVTAAPADLLTYDSWGLLALIPTFDALRRSHAALYEVLGSVAQELRMARN